MANPRAKPHIYSRALCARLRDPWDLDSTLPATSVSQHRAKEDGAGDVRINHKAYYTGLVACKRTKRGAAPAAPSGTNPTVTNRDG